MIQKQSKKNIVTQIVFVFSCRATYILDSNLVVQHLSLNNDAVARNVDEILRTVAAFQHAEEHPGQKQEKEKKMFLCFFLHR
jgi:alkyl hydroperoxide reductase subunit AhpC